MSKIKWDLESAKWVADKAQNDISAFPVELVECDKCGAVFLPHIGHDCKNTVEIEFHEGVEDESDLIDRQSAIDAVEESRRLNHHEDGKEACAHEYEHRHFLKILRDLPPAQPQIIYCKDCRKHNKRIGFDENYHTVWKEDACPLASWRGKAQGHEFDYQFCACGERRTE